MINELGNKSVMQEMQRFLFVHSQTGIIKTPQQTSLLKRLFCQFGLPPLSVSQWRQTAVSIADSHLKSMHIPGDQSDEEGQSNHILDLQRNHSTTMANSHYGFTSGVGVTREDEVHFQRASEMWQDFWRVS